MLQPEQTDVHVARQPIFDVNLNVFGYELLFRSNNAVNNYTGIDGDQATLDVIANSFLLIGIDVLTNGKKAFINFTANALKNSLPAMLPKETIAVEILENVEPDEELICACENLKKKGYLLILDDFVFAPRFLPLIKIADIIKVDFRSTNRCERQQLIDQMRNYPLKFLAEKVETPEEFQDALRMGYSYFQGYFFCKPCIITGKDLSGYKTSYMRILQEINQPELDLKKVESIIKQDVSLSYKLLKFMNSSAFGFKTKINSLQHALALLGKKELTKWVSLIALKNLVSNKPDELILNSLIRACFAEKLAAKKICPQRTSDAFLMGMFSHLDVLLDRPLSEILEELSLSEEIKRALLEKEQNQFFILYQLIKTYEIGNWKDGLVYIKQLKLHEHDVLKAYRESLIWAHNLIMCNH
ncbi:EAL and HDOD domain-containing protein [Anaerosinus massiliensis]|uniref:EAL and HDOD domain-containing protein n=1 Tax=Massilibacillus massiliensis TaxID=1806837 RepID=UPI000A6B867C|nr:HDOD domain-containing protein [Massilibacillus massiliensis]